MRLDLLANTRKAARDGCHVEIYEVLKIKENLGDAGASLRIFRIPGMDL